MSVENFIFDMDNSLEFQFNDMTGELIVDSPSYDFKVENPSEFIKCLKSAINMFIQDITAEMTFYAGDKIEVILNKDKKTKILNLYGKFCADEQEYLTKISTEYDWEDIDESKITSMIAILDTLNNKVSNYYKKIFVGTYDDRDLYISHHIDSNLNILRFTFKSNDDYDDEVFEWGIKNLISNESCENVSRSYIDKCLDCLDNSANNVIFYDHDFENKNLIKIYTGTRGRICLDFIIETRKFTYMTSIHIHYKVEFCKNLADAIKKLFS